MAGDADLEIGLRWDRARDALWANLRFETAGTRMDDWGQPDEPLELDLDRLKTLSAALDTERYGTELAGMLLRGDDIGPFYRKAVQTAQRGEMSLHVRLHITAPAKYHAIRWETLRDPESGDRIAMRSDTLMSRYLSSHDWRPVPAREKHDLSALVVVAGPTNLDTERPNGRELPPVAVEAEEARAREALTGFRTVRALTNGEAGLVPMLDALEEKELAYDVLYLVCHGALIEDVPQLYLECPDASADVVDGRALVELFMTLDRRPTVVMLCSCQSATRGNELWTGDDGELSALGPRLAAAGVASIVGMQGDISMTTAETFVPAFFTDLAEHGFVDHAMATARRRIERSNDWWVPVLYSRLRSGRTYYKPEFSDKASVAWEDMRLQLTTKNILPVLGPGLADHILGSRQDIARRWVARWQMPVAAHNQADLAQVGQFLLVRGNEGMVRAQLLEHLDTEITNRIDKAKDDPDDPFHGLAYDAGKPQAAIEEVGRRLRADDDDPYRVAAALPANVYVTTAWTDLLQHALRDRDREPVTMSFKWNLPVDPGALDDFVEPTVEQPLIYHLFGRLEDRWSLVLTEDDYFGWYSAWLRRRTKEVPGVVKDGLLSRALLFLGFQLDDWDFRVIFHGIKSFDGSRQMEKNRHVGVQISPENQLIEPEAAQEYLESYFGGADALSIFWGDTKRFLKDFRDRTGLEV